jgi:uncharacterized membrane protein
VKTLDKYWKWVTFYVNAGDPALFVKKRYGVGYTLNFGNRWSWLLLGLILVAIILPLSVPVFITLAIKHRLHP